MSIPGHPSSLLARRRLLVRSLGAAGTLMLGGCDAWVQNDSVQRVLEIAESLTKGSQRLLLREDALAREFTEADLSPVFKANGTQSPDTDEYTAQAETRFAKWQLVI